MQTAIATKETRRVCYRYRNCAAVDGYRRPVLSLLFPKCERAGILLRGIGNRMNAV